MSVDSLYRSQALIMFFRVLNTDYLADMRDFILKLAFTHTYSTRNRNNYKKPLPKYRSVKLNFVYIAIGLWNELPLEIVIFYRYLESK